MENQDNKVKMLFEVIQKKKAEISQAEKPHWITNCSFGYSSSKDASNRINIQAVTDPEELVRALAFLIEKENAYTEASVALGIGTTFKWMGYTLIDWKTDFQTRINKLQITKKKAELDTLERRLDSIVSPEMRREMELKEIESLLND